MFTPQNLRPPTSADVARAAGVSRATVSFVLNDKPGARVSAATRERVLKAARDLGYTMNLVAQSLRTGEVEDIVLPAPTIDPIGSLYATLLRVLVRRVDARGLAAVIRLDQADSSVQAATEWARRRPRAVVAAVEHCDIEATDVLRKAGLQALVLYGIEPVDHAPCVVLDQSAYGPVAIDYLAGQGHRQIAYFRPLDTGLEPAATVRWQSAVDAAASAGVELETIEMSADPASLRDWAHGWRFGAHPPSAAITYDDRYAFVLARALTEAGVSIGADIAIVGADDDPTSPLYIPAITTVAYDLEEIAERILDAIDALLAGEVVRQIPVSEPRLIERDSTGR